MKTAHDVKLLNGSKQEVSYTGVETVTMPGTDGQDKVFTAGTPIDAMDIQPDFSGGDMHLEAPEGYVVRSATIKKPDGAEQVIAKGHTLAGIAGAYVTPGTGKEIILDFSAGSETDYLPQLTVTTALDGTYGYFIRAEGGTPLTVGDTYLVSWDGTAYTCAAQDASALMDGAVCVGNATAFGLTGSDEPFVAAYLQGGFSVVALTDTEPTEHTVRIYQVSDDQTVTAEGGERWSEVTVKKPENLVPGNIAKGVEIAGVVGAKPVFTHFAVDGAGNFEINDAMFDTPPTYVRSNAFLSASTITSVTLTEATGIGNSAFYSCTGLTTASFSACTRIGDNAFAYCQKLSQASFPACTSIGGYAFSNCSSLTTTSFSACTIIGYGAFANCSSLTTTSFPACTSIGSYAFSNCSSLTTTSFPACTSIGSYAFSNCYRLSQVSFPACTSIGTYAFADCSSLTTTSFPACTSIGYAAFAYCQKLSQASFPACTSIGNDAFSNCSSLTTASFPACEFIGGYAFTSCSRLNTFSFPVCKSIGFSAFYSCTRLNTASFPACKSIGSNAFRYCYNLLSLYLLGSSVPSLGLYAFSSTPISTYTTSTGGVRGSVFVRESLLASFQSAPNWSVYSAQMVGLTDEEIAALDVAQEEPT